MIRVLIVDDQELVRDGIVSILAGAEDIEVVAEASNGRQAVALARAHHPDVVQMDVRMPEMDGIEAARVIAGDPALRCRVVVLTTFDLDEYVYRALRAGASGFLLKDMPGRELVDAVRHAHGGDVLLASPVTRRLLDEFCQRPPPTHGRPEPLAALTDREVEVLEQIALGGSNQEIAEVLFLSEATVKTHVAHILTKLGLRDRVHAVITGYETGLVRPGRLSAPDS